jgi:hypothetical protein
MRLKQNFGVNAVQSSSGIASPCARKPFSTPATLRIGLVQDLVPASVFRVVGVGETFGDYALQVRVDHGPAESAPFANNVW